MECRLAGEIEVLGENLPQRHFCPSQNLTWPDPGLNLGRRGGKSLPLLCYCISLAFMTDTNLYSQDIKASRCAELEAISPCICVIIAFMVCLQRMLKPFHCLRCTFQAPCGLWTVNHPASMKPVSNVTKRKVKRSVHGEIWGPDPASPDGLRNQTSDLDGWCPGRDSNRAASEYKPEALPLEPVDRLTKSKIENRGVRVGKPVSNYSCLVFESW
jgi:hypothetical protein